MLVAAKAPIGVLLADQPFAGTNRRGQTILPTCLGIARDQTMQDLTLIENHRVTARLAVMPRESPLRALQTQFPIQHSQCALMQISAAGDARRCEECFDDVTGGFWIAGQPCVFETPSGRHTACVRKTLPDVLSVAEPIQRGVHVR